MKNKDLFTAPQVAKICSTDLKTIHNWVNRDEINYFRTPGRHLRFRRDDVLEFLNKFGYPVPAELENQKPLAIIIDGNSDISSSISSVIEETLKTQVFSDHFDALIQIGKNEPSIVLINNTASDEMLKIISNLRKFNSETPILVYGESNDCTSEKVKLAGATDCVASNDVMAVSNRTLAIAHSFFKQAG